MLKHNWVTGETAEDFYGVRLNSLYVFRTKQGKEVTDRYFKTIRGEESYVDVGFLQYRHKLREDLRMMVHELYFELMEYADTEFQLATAFSKRYSQSPHSWNSFITNHMWARVDHISLTSGHISLKLRQFAYFGLILLRRLEYEKRR